jgi:outer membrane protein/adhesin transport system outer membrane protein
MAFFSVQKIYLAICVCTLSIIASPLAYARDEGVRQEGFSIAPDLQKALAAAYQHHPDVKLARQRYDEAKTRIDLARTGYKPDISASADARFSDSNINGADSPQTYSLELQQPLYNGGTTTADIEAAKLSRNAAYAAYHAMVQDVLFDAADKYVTVYVAQSLIAINKKNVARLQKQFNAANIRFELGDISKTDVAQTKARLAAAESNLIEAKAELQKARASFLRVMNYTPEVLTTPDFKTNLPATAQEAEELALNHNFKVIEADFLTSASQKNIQARKGDFLPDVNMVASMSRTYDPSFGFGGAGDREDQTQVGINATMPLYRAGRPQAELKLAEHEYSQSRLSQDKMRQDVKDDALRAFYDYEATLAKIESRAAGVTAADIAYQGMLAEQEFGRRSVLELLDAEQALLEAETERLNAEKDRFLAMFRLLAVTGALTADFFSLE